MPDKLQALYDNLSKMNPDFKVSLDQFRQDMQDENKLKTLHTNLGKNYPDFKVGYDQFKSDMWSTNPQPSGPTAPAAPENPTPRGMVFPDLTPAGLSFQEKSLTVPGAVSAVLPTTVPEVQPTMETVGASKLAASPLNVFENKVVSPGVQQTEVANPEDYFKEGIKETAGAAMPTEKPSFASKMGKSFGWGLTAGSASTGSWIADTPGFIYNLAGAPFRAVGLDVPRAEDFKGGALEQVSNYYKKQAAAYENKLTAMNPGRERGIQGAFSSGDLGGGILNLTESIAQSLPASIAMMLSGGATLPTILSGTAVFGAGKAQEMAKLAPQMNADKRDFVAAINGTLEGVFETWLGSGAVAKALTDVVKKEGADAAKGQIKNSLRTIFTKAITDNPWLAPLGEGFEEVGTQLAQNLVDKYSGYKPNLNITDGVADSMWAGVGMGGLHGAAIGLAKAAVADQKKAQFVNARAQAAQTVQQNFQQLAQPDGNLHIGTNKNGNEVVIVSQTPGGMAILQDGTIADISDISDIQLHPFESLFGQQMAEFDAANDPDLQPQEAPQVQATFNWNGRTMQLTDVSDKNDLMVQEIDNEGEPVGRPEKISSEEYRKILEQQVTAPDATAELRTYDIGGKSVPFTPEANGNLTSEAFNSPEEVEAAKTDLEKQIGAENDIAVNKVPGPDNMSPATYTISITPKMGDTFDQLFEKPGEVKPKKDITEQLFAKEGEQPASYMLNGQPIERGKAMARVKAAIFDGNRKKIDNLEVSGDKEMTDMIDKAFPVKMTIGKKKASMEDALNWIDSADNLDELHKLKIEGAPATSDIRTAYVMKVKELVPEITPEESDKMLSELFVKEEPEQKVEEPIKTEENDSRNSTRIPSGEPRREATEQAGPDKTRGGSETAAGGNVQGNGQVEQAARETEQVGGTEVRAEDQRQETVAEKPGLKKPSFQRKKKVSPSKLVDLYKTRLTKLKKENPHTYWSVDLPSDADLLSAAEDGRLIDMAGGMAYVTKDGDLKGLFKYDPEAHGTAKALQAERIKMGGIKLDAYDTEGTGEVSLVPTYKKNGFREVARVDFNPEYAPEDMPKDIKDMNPDIVVMVYDPENKLDIKERRFNKDQYEDALAYRDSYVTEEPVPDHNKSADTQAFFSDVVTGTSDKFKPNKPWEPILKFSAKEEAVRPVFEKFNGNFDTHIATSIPAFRDVQIKVVSALNQMFGKKGGLIYDIGGSEGGFVKSITELSDGRMKSINLDANGDMEAVHNATPVEGSEFVKEAFGEGFEWDGVTYPRHEPKQKADVVHESMTFQFIDEKRADKVEEVVNNYLKPDGLFISEEKVHPASQAQWAANEAKKDKDFKSRYYEAGQISAKKEEVLTGMVTNQTSYDRYKNELRKKFDYVEEYWDGGNFKGLVASNDKAKVDQFLAEVGNTDTEFSEKNINPEAKPSFKKKPFSLNNLIKQAAAETDTNPTEAQIEAGNYKKGHVDIQGMDISIENPKGSTRSGVDEDGKAWETTMKSHYGYFKGSVGKDGDHIDVFIGPKPENETIYVIDQNDPNTGEFDESKVMLGYESAEQAKEAYLANYEPGWKGFGAISEIPVDKFKAWLYDGARQRKPFSEYVEIKRPVSFQAKKLYAGLETVPKFKNLVELTDWLQKWSKKNKVFASEEAKSDDDKFIKALVKHTIEELKALEEVSEYPYLGFYDYDIPTRLNPELQRFGFKRYGHELSPSEIALYHLVSGFASPSADPVMDSSKGLDVFDRYMKTGELSGRSDMQATIWEVNEAGKKVDTGKPKFDEQGNPVYSQVTMAFASRSLDKFRDNVLAHFDGDLNKAMDWISSRHSYEDISKMMGTPLKGKGALAEHENLTKEDGGFGIFGFTGPKLGSYVLNRIGNFSTVTKDLWYARTMARLTGESLQEKTGEALKLPWAVTVEGKRKRALADKAWGIVADKLGITPADVQQRMWEFEKRLYEKIGASGASGTTGYASEGFLKRAKQLEPALYEPFEPAKPAYKKRSVEVDGVQANDPELQSNLTKWEEESSMRTPVHILGNEAAADAIRGTTTPEFEQDVRDTEFWGMTHNGEIYIHPETPSDFAILTWAHEKSHLVYESGFENYKQEKTFSEDLFDSLGVAEIRRVLPVEYWFDDKAQQAKEYLAMLVEDVVTQGGLIESAPDFVKSIIFDQINEFSSVKYLQDEKQRLDNRGQEPVTSETVGQGVSETTGNRPGEKDTGGPSVSTTPKGKQEINKIFSFEDLFEPSFKKAPETIEVDGVERPTLNSNGQPIHSTEEGIKNFWKWFGDSKVVDENGRPLVVYHGTAKNFEDFQVNKGDLGAHFGNIDQANQISRNNPENSSVLPVYLQLENPIRLNDEGYFESKIIAGQLLDKGLINIEEHDKLAYASKHWRQLNEMSSELLQKLGFDGVVYLNRREGIPAIEKLAASDEGPEEIRSMVGLSDEEFKTKYPEAKDSYIVLNPTQIKSATGNEGGFDPNDPRISFKRKAALKPERKQVQTTGEKIREILVNNKLALENWMKDVQTVVPKIEDYENPLLKDALAKSKVTNRLRIFEKGAYKNLINSITNVLKTSGISKEELSHYLIAVHGVERNEKFWNNNPDRVGEDFSGLTELKEIVRSQASPAEQLVIDGMNNEDFAKYYQKQIEDKAQPSQIKALWNSIRAISKLVRDEMLDSGMISREYYDELNTMYKNYIPLRAWEDPNPEDFEFSRGVGSYTEPIIRAKGRKSLAEDPLATLLQMANTAYISGERNRVKQAAGELVRNNATALKDVVQYNRTYFVTQGTDAQGNPIIQETIDRPDQTLFDQGLVSTKVPKAYTTRRTSAQAKEFEVEFYRGGKKYVLVFQGSDPAVARAINNREASVGLDYLNKVVGTDIKIGKVTIPSITKMSRYLSSINTTYSVDFPLVNFVRDAPMAMLSEWAYGDAKEVAKMFPNMKRAEAAMRRMLRGKAKPATNADDAMLEDFFAAGGPTGFAFLKNVDEFKQSIANDVRKINRIKNPFVRMEVGFRKGLDLIGQLGEWSETITRFGVYINHVEAGDSKEISALAAKNATVNFDQKGRISPALNGLYTFFNAAVQAVDKYFKLWGRNPYKMAGIHMFLVVQGFINALMLDLFGGEDDDKIKNYDKVSDYTKRNNIVIPIPGSDKTVSLAVPQILRKFHAIGFDAYDLLSGRKTAEQVMLDELASIPSDVSPIDTDAFLNKEGDISVKPLVPSILRPIVELEANENFMKMPIVPEPFSIEMAHKIADTRRAYKDVNKIAQWTTDQLYKLGGGDETGFKYVYDNGELLKVPALLDISPESIEHLFESYFGGVGKFANRTWKTTGNIFNAGQKLYEGENFREAIKEIDLNTVPVANRFVRTPVGDPLEKEFRKVRNDMENKIKVLDQAEKDQDWTKFDRMYKEIGGKINDYKVIMTTFENLDKTYNVVSKENKKAAEEIKTEMREQMKEIVKLK